MNKIIELHNIFLKSTGVCIDSRKVISGSIFFSLKGDTFNGNSFALKALELGACLSVVDDESISGGNVFLVDDVLNTLQELAKYHRSIFKIPVIALTGSNGKTTTKELLSIVLQKKYKVTSTKGNYNNHIGVPLTLLELTKDTEIAIIEMGANHVGEIAVLCELAQPTHGLITNIGKAHLEGFGGVEGIIKGKGELYDFLLINNGVTFVNKGSSTLEKMSRRLSNVVSYLDTNRFQLITNLENDKIQINDNGSLIKTNLVGDYNFSNVIVAICVGEFFDVSINDISNAIAGYTPNNNRSQKIITNKNEVIMDAYNANPTSMELALKSFSIGSKKDKVLILGDMFELGDYSNFEHNKLLELILELGFLHVFLCGHEFEKIKIQFQKMKFFPTKVELEKYLVQTPIKNKQVLIKGSRGMGLESILPLL